MFKFHSHFWLIIPVVVYLIIMGSLFYTVANQEKRTIRIDCTWSEISPDFTPEIRELCRKARSGRI
jgi:hypothetical protein